MKLNHITTVLLLIVLITFFPLFAAPVSADGIIVPPPIPCGPEQPGIPCPPRPFYQFVIRYHHVTVSIQDQIAVTRVDQVFYNPSQYPMEGTYIFPLPVDAMVSHFALWMDNEPVSGEMLDAEQARKIYEEITRSQRDPALLEYQGRGAVQAHIFPIPPQGERRIQLEYTQALAADNGLVRYTYPLNTEKFSALPIEDVSVSVDVSSAQAIRAVYSPSHAIDVLRKDANHVQAVYQAQNVLPDTDFALYYSIGENEAFHLLSYRDPSDPAEPDGFFLLLLAPKPELPEQAIPKDVILVLDRSGSMDGDKFRQAQTALLYILDHLNAQDRFDVITFSTKVDAYSSSLRPADEANEAKAWVNQLYAEGSTDINRALLEASSLADRERPTYLIFLTDGLPTEGVVKRDQILNNFSSSAPQNLHLFAFGVGYDVDTLLLDTLAQEHQGMTTYVKPGEALDEILSGFYNKISTPVLTNLSLDFGGISAYDIYPQPLPDLFLGSQVIAVGRYHDGGNTEITLKGAVNGVMQSFHFPGQHFDSDSREKPGNLDSIPRLWATRKIGYLLNKIRLQGPDQETIDQIVKLSIRYGIVTPYTSYLVDEPSPLGAEVQDRIAQKAFEQYQAMPTSSPSGAGAVQAAEAQNQLQAAQAPAAAPSTTTAGASVVRIVRDRTFVLNNNVWTDTLFDPQKMTTQKVQFLSEDYFKLLQIHPGLSPFFALGNRVIAFSGETAYEVVDPSTAVQPLDLPTVTPEPATQAASPTAPSATNPPIGPTPAPRPGSSLCVSSLLLVVGLVAFRIYRLRNP